MGLYIKEMEMPKEPGVYLLDLYVDEVCQIQRLDGATFEVIEIPPHGRLIDADALESNGWYLMRVNIKDGKYETANLMIAPTVIPAEEV